MFFPDTLIPNNRLALTENYTIYNNIPSLEKGLEYRQLTTSTEFKYLRIKREALQKQIRNMVEQGSKTRHLQQYSPG